MSWQFDVPSGTFKNNALSADIRMSAIANSQFMPFVDTEGGFGRRSGETINITRVGQLPLATRVAENVNLPDGRPAIDTVPITVSEWGYKIPLTAKEQLLAYFDMRDKLQQALRNQLRLTMDKAAADAYKQTLIRAAVNAGTLTITTNGVFGATTSRNINVSDLRNISDYMKGTLLAPTFPDGDYVAIMSVKAARGILSDTEFKDWLSPTNPTPFVNGELPRRVEGFRIIVSNHANALSNGVGTGSVAGEAIFFGPDAVAMANAMDPELRVGLTRDLGRFQDIGWLGLFEIGNVWPEATPGYGRTVYFGSL